MADGRARSGYELLDLGDGRRLEAFGPLVVDRPFPAAPLPRRTPKQWTDADLRFDRQTAADGAWRTRDDADLRPWTMQHDGLTFELRPTPSGQVGFFGEQIPLWRWLREAIAAHPSQPSPEVLNLFAFTGGATLALAAAGARVAHVDASRPSVAWARRNAELSGLGGAPIRWLVDDAAAFLRREARRGRRYDGIVLDPPSYGHGPKGERWTLRDQLAAMFEATAAVLQRDGFVLLTAHTTGLDADEAAQVVRSALRRPVDRAPLLLSATSGAEAPAGIVVSTRP